MDLYEIDESKKVVHLESAYSERFKDLFGSLPLIDNLDRSALRRLIKAVRVDKERLTEIVLGIFELDDDFVKKSGFKLQFVDSRANAIMTMNGRRKKTAPKGLCMAIRMPCGRCGQYFETTTPLGEALETTCVTCKGIPEGM